MNPRCRCWAIVNCNGGNPAPLSRGDTGPDCDSFRRDDDMECRKITIGNVELHTSLVGRDLNRTPRAVHNAMHG